MKLTFVDYQAQAKETDQKAEDADVGLVIAMLGLVGEAGSLLSEYKKRLRDGEAHRGFKSQVAEELGDLLWYLATIATRSGLSLEEIAVANLAKTRARWLPPDQRAPLFDEGRPRDEQLPRRFVYRYEDRVVDEKRKVVLVDELGHKRKSNDTVDHLDEVEDGARAQIAEELVAAAAYEYASRHDYLNVDHVDWDLLRLVKRITSRFEVRVRTEAEWEEAILLAFRVWRDVRRDNGGTLRGDLVARTLEHVPPTPAP